MTLKIILSSLLFAVSANIDSIVVGISLGLKNIKVGTAINLLIALILSAVTVLSIAAGSILYIIIPIELSNMIGGGILIIIGLYSFIKPLYDTRHGKKTSKEDKGGYLSVLEAPEKADKDSSGNIDARESILLAAALSLNNLGMGIGAGITGLNLYITAVFSFVLSIAFLSAGCRLGKRFALKAFGEYASVAGAALIILLGVYEALF